MISRLLLLLALAVAPAAHAALPDDLVSDAHRITVGQNDSAWAPLVAELKANAPLSATFDEYRYFPFRKGAAKLTGEIRLDPVRGLSLNYTSPEKQMLVVDAKGGFMADSRGRRRELPDDPRARAATSALLDVLRFDLRRLAENFDIYAARDADTWRFNFTPKPGPLADVLHPIIVTGEGAIVKNIEMRKTASQRVEILIGETHTRITFPPEELARFFR